MKRVLVSGGSRGVGLAICRTLLEAGWHVSTISRKSSPELDDLLRSEPARIRHLPLDLANQAQLRDFLSSGWLRDLDALVANAGIGTEGLLTLTPVTEIQKCIDVNLMSSVLIAREAIKGMLTSGGSIVFISSVAATTGFAGLSVYSATKGGLLAFSRSIAREYGERGIRSNCILPGILETEMSATLSAEQRQRIERRSALQRLGLPEDVLGAVVFLLSDAARFITGAEIVIDGGLTA